MFGNFRGKNTVKYSSVLIVIKPNIQTTIQVIFDPPIDKAPQVIVDAEPNNGYYELKEFKSDNEAKQ